MTDTKLIVRKLETGIDGLAIVQLRGPVMLTTLAGFRESVHCDCSSTLILDMTEVPYVDSAALGSLVHAHVSRVNAGRKLLLAGVAERVAMIMKVTGINKVFAIFPTCEAAQAALGQASP